MWGAVEKQLIGGRTDVETRLQWWISNFEFRVSQATGRLASGEWSILQFQEFGRKEIKDSLYGIAETGIGRRLTRKEMYQVRRVLKVQVGFWDRFASDIVAKMKALDAEGLVSDEHEAAREKLMQGLLRRAKSYSGAIEAEGQKWLMAARYEDGQWFEWDMNPELENCETCKERDKKRHQMKGGRLPFYPKDGSTICLYNCGCDWLPVEGGPGVEKAKPVIGKRGEKGRFVTLKSGQVIFIPAGKRTKWANVKEQILGEGRRDELLDRFAKLREDFFEADNKEERELIAAEMSHLRGELYDLGVEDADAAVEERRRERRPELAEGAVEGGFGDPSAIADETSIGDGITRPTLVEFDGDAGVHKYDRNVHNSYGHPDAEVLAYEVSEALGFEIVPKTIRWEREPSKDQLREMYELEALDMPFEEFVKERGGE